MAANLSLSESFIQKPSEQARPSPGSESSSDMISSDSYILTMTERALKILSSKDSILNEHIEECSCVRFSSDGSKILAGLKNNIDFWILENRHITKKGPLTGHTTKIVSAVFSPDKKHIISAEKEDFVKIWRIEPDPEALLWTSESLGEINDLKISADGFLMAIASSSNKYSIKIRGVLNKEPEYNLPGKAKVNCLAFHPVERFLASGTQDCFVKIWNLDSAVEKLENTLNGHDSAVFSIAFSSDGSFLVTGSWDGGIKVWNFKDRVEEFALFGLSETVHSLACSNDGKLIASGHEQIIKIWDFSKRQEKMSLHGHSHTVKSLAFSPNKPCLVSGSSDQTVRIWNLKDKNKARSIIVHKNNVLSVSFTPSSDIILTGCKDGRIRGWNIEEKKEVITLHVEKELKGKDIAENFITFSSDGNFLAQGVTNCAIVWDYKKASPVFSKIHQGSILSISLSVNGRFLATVSDDNCLRIWDVPEKEQIKFASGEVEPATSTIFSPDGSFLAVADEMKLKIYSVAEWSVFQTFQESQRKVSSISFSDNSKFLAAGFEDGQLQIISMKKPFEKLTLSSSSSSISSVAFTPDSLFVLTGHNDSTLVIWNVREKREEVVIHTGTKSDSKKTVCSVTCSRDGKFYTYASFADSLNIWSFEENVKTLCLQQKTDIEDSVNCISYSPNGKIVVAGFANKKIKVFDLETGKNKELSDHRFSVLCVRFSNDGKFMATGSKDKTVKIWDMQKCELLYSITKPHEFLVVTDVLILSRVSVIVTCSSELAIKTWELKSQNGEKKPLKVLTGHSASVTCLASSPDERTFVSGSSDCTLKVWKIGGDKEEFSLVGHSQAVCSVEFSPNGKYLATGSEDRSIKLWNVQRRCEEFSLPGHSKAVKSLSYSPDGRFLACASGNSLKVWDLEEKIEKFGEKINSDQVLCVSFSPDGRQIATGCNDGSLRLWDFLENNKKSFKDLEDDLIAYSNDGSFAVSGAETGELFFWSLEEKPLQDYPESQGFQNWRVSKALQYPVSPVHSQRVNSIDYSTNEEFIVSASDDGTLAVLNARNRNVEYVLAKDSGPVLSCKFSNNSSLVAAGFKEKPMKIWSLDQSVQSDSPLFEKLGVCFIEFSPKDRLLASAALDGSLEVWDLQEKLKLYTCTEYFLGQPFKLSADEWFICFPVSVSYYKIVTISDGSLFKEFRTDYKISDIVYSEYSDYILVCTTWGFDVFFIEGGFFLESFCILSYENLTLSLEILSKKFDFSLSKPLNLNNLTTELLIYQHRNNNKVEIHKSCIDTNANLDFSKRNFPRQSILYQGALHFISKESMAKLSHIYYNLVLTQYFQTVLHLQTFQGLEKSIENILQPGKLELIPVDKFGKSPIFYAIKKKHFRCAQLFLKYLININKKSDSLYLQLKRIQNEFLLIIQSSFKELPTLLNKFIFETDSKMISENRETPQLLIFDEQVNPLYLLDEEPGPVVASDPNEKKEDNKQMPALVKYFSTALPIQIYSTENIEILTALQTCSNVKIFENILIQQFIDYNWEEVKVWIQGYSALSVLNLLLFSLLVAYGRTVLWIYVPFMVVFALLLMWEVLQIMNSPSLAEYFKDPMNWVDLSTLALVVYWSLAGFLGFASVYEEFLLAFLIALRGITSFRIFDGTRSYFRLIIQSLNGMKHFVLVFLYSTFVFTVLLYILNLNNEKHFFIVFESVWNLNFTGAYQEGYSLEEVTIYLVAIIATILNVVLMLNLLISILSDNYDGFMIDRQVHDFKEKIDSALEIQTTLFWNKKHNKRKFLYILCTTFKDGEDNQNNDWPGKIKYLEQSQIRKIMEVEERVSDLLGKTSDVDEKIAEVDFKVSGVEDNIKGLVRKFRNTDEKVLHVNSNVDKVDSKITNVNSKVHDVENNIKGLMKKFTDFDEKVDSKITQVEYNIKEVVRKFNSVDDKVSEVEENIIHLSRRLRDVDDNVSEMSEQITEILSILKERDA